MGGALADAMARAVLVIVIIAAGGGAILAYLIPWLFRHLSIGWS
jgi:hypothetical protein